MLNDQGSVAYCVTCLGLMPTQRAILTNRIRSFHFDRHVASMNPLRNRWMSVFDAADQQVGTEDALGRRTSSVIDPAGRVTASIEPLDNRHH